MRLDLASAPSMTGLTQSTSSFPQGNDREDCRVITTAHSSNYFYIDRAPWEGNRDQDSLHIDNGETNCTVYCGVNRNFIIQCVKKGVR